MRAEGNDFNLHLGDTMYSDSEIPGRLEPVALTVPAKWAKYKRNLDNAPLRMLRRTGAFYSHWDDHEFINDFAPPGNTFSSGRVETNINGRLLYRRGVKAFRDYAPVAYSSRNGLYGPSAGAATWSCSSSTSARSGAPTPTTAECATTRTPASRTWRRPAPRTSVTCSLS
jgi:hypothetical protein